MARLSRVEVFAHDEIAVVHVMARTTRRCFLFGTDELTGKCYDHRKAWIEDGLVRCAASFGIDLLCFSILSNHFHLVLKSRPDIVETWDDTEIARRWLQLCPIRKLAKEPNERELNSIRHDAAKVKILRERLSDISWWMRLLCQRVAQRANREDEEDGKFFEARYRSVRLLDEESILACAAYVDLNPIRAALAETLEDSEYTSVQRRIQSLMLEEPPVATEASLACADEASADAGSSASSVEGEDTKLAVGSLRPDRFLAPITIDELRDELGARPSRSGFRASDKGFASMSTADYLELLDWSARQLRPGKPGATPVDAPPIFKRLSLAPSTWLVLVSEFGCLFSSVAGPPVLIDETRSRQRRQRYYVPKRTRELLQSCP